MTVSNIIIILLLVFIDRFSKILVLNFLKPIGSISIVKNFLSFTYVENYGAAFGILKNKRLFFIILTVFTMIFLLYILKTRQDISKPIRASLIMIIGGGIGNLIDRIFYGFVVDFICVSFFPPVFNIADCFITVGSVMFIVCMLFFSPDEKSENGEHS